MAVPKLSVLKGQLLQAAVECAEGDTDRTFTSEELLVTAWRKNPEEWGLRGFENEHPDSHRIDRELDSRGKGQSGLVALGLVQRVRPRVYRLTSKGLAWASRMDPGDPLMRQRADRNLEDEVHRILAHEVMKSWLRDPAQPTRFRDAGHFWSIAPGTPLNVIRERIRRIDETIAAAGDLLEHRGVDAIGTKGGSVLFDSADIERCVAFQVMLKERFARDLKVLGVEEL